MTPFTGRVPPAVPKPEPTPAAAPAQADRSPVRRRGNTLDRWEIGLIKAMIADGRWPNDQDILAHFTRPTRSVNHRAIAEIRTGTKHTLVKQAAPEDLDAFLASWPDVDPETGLSLKGDELLIKAREAMIAAVHSSLPRHVETMMDGFEQNLTAEQQADPRFAYRVFMIHKTANRAPSADLAVELVPPGSDIAEKFSMALKEVEKRKYLPSEVVAKVQGEGWNRFTMDSHTQLWKRLSAKDLAKGYGAVAVGKTWCWYEPWVSRVLEECQQNPDRYRGLP